MESLFWLLANRTAETEFIYNLFHLLLAGLTLLVLLHQLEAARHEAARRHGWVLKLGFFLLVSYFALLTVYFGRGFFFHRDLGRAGLERLSQSLLACGLVMLVAAYGEVPRNDQGKRNRWMLIGCAVLAALVLVDIFPWAPGSAPGSWFHSVVVLAIDLVALAAVAVGIRAVRRSEQQGRAASMVALASMAGALLLHSISLFLPRHAGILVWNIEQQVLSVSLFAFAWAAGERSRNLLDRIFVRLNLTFIILASLIMLITAGMEKYQYLRLAEERGLELAEFLRGHILYYQARGERLEGIFRHPEVMRRVVVEFGRLPELRQVHVRLNGEHATFEYLRNWEIKEKITSLGGESASETGNGLPNSFRMVRLPVEGGTNHSNRIEFVGTMDYINAYIGKYILLIYSLFTMMVALATVIIGMIVADTDRRLRQQYAELRETHQQLAQAAKLASIGQLAGGMAHEINTPITSILALASHLAEGRNAATLAPAQRNSLQLIGQQAQRVSRIVTNLLIFSRQSYLEAGPVDVPEVLETAISLVQCRLTSSAILLRRDVDADLQPILGDTSRLTEVFVNLLNNAIDAMPGGGVLLVRVFSNAQPGSGVSVEVTDTGCGVPPENLLRIFDPFFTTKEPGRGTGLGLSISHGIVTDHGGQIWAESCPGAGTTLVVTLPTERSRNGTHPGD